jgi:hypothetical protein
VDVEHEAESQQTLPRLSIDPLNPLLLEVRMLEALKRCWAWVMVTDEGIISCAVARELASALARIIQKLAVVVSLNLCKLEGFVKR